MLDHVLHSYAASLGYARKLTADLTDAQMTAQPAGVTPMNHAAWVLGHIASTSFFIANLLGAEAPPAPAAWEKLFGWGSKPVADSNAYPKKADLLKALEQGHAVVAAALPQVPAARWNDPFPVQEMRSFVPTFGDGIVFLMTAHEAIHLGQLSAWRRALGLPSVM